MVNPKLEKSFRVKPIGNNKLQIVAYNPANKEWLVSVIDFADLFPSQPDEGLEDDTLIEDEQSIVSNDSVENSKEDE